MLTGSVCEGWGGGGGGGGGEEVRSAGMGVCGGDGWVHGVVGRWAHTNILYPVLIWAPQSPTTAVSLWGLLCWLTCGPFPCQHFLPGMMNYTR